MSIAVTAPVARAGAARRAAPVQPGRALVGRVIDYARAHDLQAGERFPAERNLAQTLGVSRNALREALATLESFRVVELRPNSGVYLRALGTESSFEATVLLAELGTAPDAAEVRETIEVRAALERQAITLACARRTPDDLARLTRISHDSGAVIAAKGNITDCDQAFHLALANASQNSVLVRMLNAFYCLTLERRRIFFADPKRGLASCVQHDQLIAAIARRNVSRAIKLMDAHLGNAQVYWKETLAPAGQAAPVRASAPAGGTGRAATRRVTTHHASTGATPAVKRKQRHGEQRLDGSALIART